MAKPIPGVAESWGHFRRRALVYTFHFRDDAKWSNGRPGKPRVILSSPCAASKTRQTGGAVCGAFLYPIKNAEKVNKGDLPKEELGVKAIDDKTLEITLEYPNPPIFLSSSAISPALPLHQKSVEALGADFRQNPATWFSNGAFTLAEFVSQQPCEKPSRNPMFPMMLDNVQNRRGHVLSDRRSRCGPCAVSRAGELQSNKRTHQFEQVAFMREELGDQFPRCALSGHLLLRRPTPRKRKLSDPKIRRALSHGD